MIKANHRRKGEKRTEHASTWEGQTEGQRGVARGRRRWKSLRGKAQRRTGKVSQKFYMSKHRPLPEGTS